MKGTGSFNIKLNESAKPYFFDLKNNFTALQLKSVLNCSSKYAKRLYAIARKQISENTDLELDYELKKEVGNFTG